MCPPATGNSVTGRTAGAGLEHGECCRHPADERNVKVVQIDCSSSGAEVTSLQASRLCPKCPHTYIGAQNYRPSAGLPGAGLLFSNFSRWPLVFGKLLLWSRSARTARGTKVVGYAASVWHLRMVRIGQREECLCDVIAIAPYTSAACLN
jgi:hypothetical protein